MAFISSIIQGIGAISQADASRHAANQQADAAKNAQQLQLDMFNRNKQDVQPWVTSGQRGNTELMRLLGLGSPDGFDPNAQLVRPFGMQDFQTDPGYQFRLQEGENAVLNNRSAMGGLNSGATMRALEQYGQGFASNEYQNAFNRYNTQQGNVYNRLAGLSNTGANSALGVAGLGANAAFRAGDFGTQAGNAQAAGTIGQSNALMGGASGIMNQWLQANALQQGGFGDQPGMNGAAPGYMQLPQQTPGWVSQG